MITTWLGQDLDVQEGARDLSRGGHRERQQHWQFHHPWPGHTEDQGWQERGVWQGDEGEGQEQHDEVDDDVGQQFQELDSDSNGYINANELRQWWSPEGQHITDEEVQTYFGYVDEDGDGQINFEEFELAQSSVYEEP